MAAVQAPGTLSFQQIEKLWTDNGGDPGWAPFAAAIALAESGGDTVVINNTPATGDYSVGLWQINYFGGLAQSRSAAYGSPAALQADPNAQAKAAIALSGNGANWQPWQGDPAYKAWSAAGSPNRPSAYAVAPWLAGGAAAEQGIVTPGTAPNEGAPASVAAGGATLGGGVLGIPQTAPAPPSFGLDPIADLGSGITYAVQWGGWALLVMLVGFVGFVMVVIGLVLLGLVLAGPVATPLAAAVGGKTAVGRLGKAVGGAQTAGANRRYAQARALNEEQATAARGIFDAEPALQARTQAQNREHRAAVRKRRGSAIPANARRIPATPRTVKAGNRTIIYDDEPF